MRINFDRLSQLAGLPASGNRRNLYEGKDHEKEEAAYEGTALEGLDAEPMEELDELDLPDEATEMAGMDMPERRDSAETLDEMIEVDEVMLVQELRRAKAIMQENKRRRLNESRNRQIFERQLKQVIDEEVQNVMDEMNLTSGWVYGDRRPRNSRKGYTNQGSMMPGVGFRRR